MWTPVQRILEAKNYQRGRGRLKNPGRVRLDYPHAKLQSGARRQGATQALRQPGAQLNCEEALELL